MYTQAYLNRRFQNRLSGSEKSWNKYQQVNAIYSRLEVGLANDIISGKDLKPPGTTAG